MLIFLKTEKKSRFSKILAYVWTGPYKMYLHVINSYLGTPGLTTFLFQEPITSAPVYSYSSLTWLGYTLPKMFVATQLQIIMGFCLCTATPISPLPSGGGGSVWSKNKGGGGAEKDHKKDKQVSSLYEDFCYYYYNVMSSHNARSGRAQLYSSKPLNAFNTLDFRRSSPDASLHGCWCDKHAEQNHANREKGNFPCIHTLIWKIKNEHRRWANTVVIASTHDHISFVTWGVDGLFICDTTSTVSKSATALSRQFIFW